jgi:hypothetical protein
MIDSTYMVASDPNSMRDTGPVRNAEYRVQGEPGKPAINLCRTKWKD